MSRNKTYFPYAVVIGLSAILIVLAVMQYRWSNQVSQAESDRMKASLRIATSQFRQDFARELQNVSSGLQPDADLLADADWSAYAKQSADWLKSSTDQDLVSAVYLWRPAKPLLQLNRKNNSFDPAEPPAALEPVFERIRQQTEPARQGRAFRPLSWTMDGAVPALFHSLYVYTDPEAGRSQQPPTLAGFTIVQLNRAVIESRFLPDLANRHFGGPDGFLYNVGVFVGGDAAHPVYQSAQAFGKKAIASADISIDLLDRPNNPGRGPQSAPSPPPAEPRREPARDEGREPQFRDRPPEPPVDRPLDANGDPVRERGPRRANRTGPPPTWARGAFGRGFSRGLGAGRFNRRGATDAPSAEAPASRPPSTMARNAFASQERLRQARRLGLSAPPQPIVPDVRSSWLLVIRHRAGSVDAAVAALRTRNLAVSFAILLLLGVSMAMIVITSQRAQRLARLQVEFVAGVSHELRTPLAVISSAADNLTDGIIESKPQVKLYGTLIRNEARRLEGMMEHILEFASGQKRRTYDPKILSVPALIDTALSFCSTAIEEVHAKVETVVAPDLAPVLAEEHGLLQCLQNLIFNAVKYGGEQRWIGIDAHMEAGQVVVSVADRGLGIDPEDLPHIFDAFYRGRAATEAQIHGTGLGLSLAKSFAQAAGGNIAVQSSPGAGATFTLRLPAAKPAVDQPRPLLLGRLT